MKFDCRALFLTAIKINRVAFLGDYMPRQCGIATFTTDICEAVAAEFPECELSGGRGERPTRGL